MKLLLSSDSKTAIRNIELVWDKPFKPKIAWVITPTKTQENSSYLDRSLKNFGERGIDPKVYDINGKSTEEFGKDLKDVDIIFIEGGNTFYLLKQMRASGFDEFILDWVSKGNPIIGVSAGTYVACPTIEMALWKKHKRETFGMESDLKALGLVDFLITVHYDEKWRNEILEGMNLSSFNTRILKDGQALFVNDSGIRLVGDPGEVILN